MARGQHPTQFFRNPRLNKAPERLWEELNNFTDEVFEENVERYNEFSAFILLPPCFDKSGHFVKGILATHAVDFLVARWPWLPAMFHMVAYAMWSGYPRAERADAFMVPYRNDARKKWYDKKYPRIAHLPVFSVDDTDLFNEMFMVPPAPDAELDIDILQVARLDQIKNLDMYAGALRIIGQQRAARGLRPLKAWLHTGSVVKPDWSGLAEAQVTELQKIERAFGSRKKMDELLTISPKQLGSTRELYQRARCVVMTALCEGRNRSIHEAMSCNVPVVTFEDFNKYSRGSDVVFPAGAGLRAPKFTAESLAATLMAVLEGPLAGKFVPRQMVLQQSGRRAVTQTVLEGFSEYYQEKLPGYVPGQRLESNAWLAEQMANIYHCGIEQWWFAHEGMIGKPRFHSKGLKDFTGIAQVYEKLVYPPSEPEVLAPKE